MNKKLLVAILCILPFSLYSQSPKFGHCDLQAIFEGLPDKTAADKKLESLYKKYESEMVKLQEEATKKYTDFMNEGDTLPDAIKQRRMQNIQELQQRIETFREQAAQDLEKEKQSLMAPIQDKIRKAVAVVGDEQKFEYIMNVGGGAVLLYTAPSSHDVSALVKAKIESMQPAEKPAPVTPATTKPATPRR